MKPSELRQGNYVNTPRADQNPFRVDYFDMDKVYQNNGTYKTDLGGTEYTIPFHPLTWDLKDCSPIPLSPEILEKCGFVKKGRYAIGVGGYQVFVNGRIELLQPKKGGPYILAFHEVKIAYLHQLQNLYFALTGEELTINL